MPSGYDEEAFFKTYYDKSSEKRSFIKSFQSRFKSPNKDSMAFLDLGSHDGRLFLDLYDSVKDKLPKEVRVVAVDPSEDAIARYRARSLPAGLRVEFQTMTAEDFFTIDTSMFDYVIASHSLYWTKKIDRLLNTIARRAPESVIVCRGATGIYQIQAKFEELLGNPQERLYTADVIESRLAQLGVQYRRENIQSRIEIPRHGSQEFKWLISFFLQTQEDALKEEDWKAIRSFLRPLGEYLKHDVSFFWLD